MSIGNPLQRLRRSRGRSDWRALALEYLRDPHAFWGPDKPRHAEKLQTKKRALRQRDGRGDDKVIDGVLAMAEQRRTQRPAPVYVTGLGGSGSHWVAGMLGDLGGLAPAGEVYLPAALITRLGEFDDADQAAVVDAVHLLHAWPRTPDLVSCGVVNNAAGVNKAPSWKRWDSRAVAFHLLRDPRDQVMSVAFRKQRFRAYEDPEASDLEYLERMSRRNAAAYRAGRAVADQIDVRWRYEDLCDDPRPMLRQVLSLRGRPIDDDLVDEVARRHDAETIRSGEGTKISNLDAAGKARPWHEVADSAQRRILHTGLVDAVHGLGYRPEDCMGMAPPRCTAPQRRMTWIGHALPGPVYRRHRGQWVALSADDAAVDASVPVLLRVGGDDTGDDDAIARLGPDDVQVLCLSGNPRTDDVTMQVVAGLHGLAVLDISGTAVTDAGVRALEALRGLRQLHLDGTTVTPQASRALIEVLPNLTIRPQPA